MVAIAVIGGGVSGLVAAWAARRHGCDAVVFEAGPRLGGRAVTASHGQALFDTGAQFFRTEGGAAEELILHQLDPGDLLDIRAEVRPFVTGGAVGDGDPAQNALPKWVYRRGIGQLASVLARASGATIHLGWRCDRLVRAGETWTVEGAAGRAGPFEAVVVTPPPPVLCPILERSTFDRGAREALLQALESARYRPIISVTSGFHEPFRGPDGAYALVNIDRGHAISWLAFEHEKPGYVPAGHGVITAQMGADWSRPRMTLGDESLAREAFAQVQGLLGDELPRQAWTHVTRWPAALPDVLVPAERLQAAEHLGLFAAGDCTAGGRVHLAVESGMVAGERLGSWLSSRTRDGAARGPVR
ncbi:MAG: FAD-dependent oxidoreductase [Dehalococcoidia bacterium]